MSKSAPIFSFITLLLFVSLACALPNLSTPDPSLIGTTVAQTIIADLTQSAPSLTPTFTFTPEPPTLTPTLSSSLTPIFTFTPLVPLISVSVATNCRVGPGKIYERVGALLVGETTEVYALDPTGNYWYVRNPDTGPEFCWLWGEYATVSGNISALPIYTPPPTPTPVPAFEASYEGKETCVGWWVDIELKNTGGLTFKSISLTVRDTNTDVVLSMYADGFTDNSGCLDSTKKDNLNPGTTLTISTPAFNYDPSGHRLRATITLCSGLGQNGVCVTQAINFIP
ncbi:MAG TPA: SH3 domain-containing protein [Anaerolineales bacterium]|nr:SH3 domain-containing protein [Anaerolineales bacterium]